MTDREIHYLFHTLWTKAVGTADYDKSEWKRLSDFIYEHIKLSPSRNSSLDPILSRPSRYERKPVI
jgi:hypothetical protein